MDEREIIPKLQENDQQAWKIFYEEFGDYVFQICKNYTRDHDEADDLTQEVFLRIYQSICRFRGESTIKTWIHKIVETVCTNHINKEKHRKKLAPTDSLDDYHVKGIEFLDDHFETPLNKMITKENEKEFYDALDKLPQNQYVAVKYCVIDLKTYEEAAKAMNKSKKAVDGYLRRARIKLKNILNKD